jgi:hypothetical protein
MVVATSFIRYYGHVLNSLKKNGKIKNTISKGLRKKIDDL